MILSLFLVLIGLFVVLPLVGMALWAILSTILVGLILGGLGRLVIPGRQPIGFFPTVLSGLCGSIVGGFVGQHVLGVSWLPTVLLEIGIAALLVALIGRSARHRARW